MKYEHSLQRKAAIAYGKGSDHAGSVDITPISDFDLQKTIFSTLEGTFPRMVIKAKIAKEVRWDGSAAQRIDQDYTQAYTPLPEINPNLISFMENECDFSMEHADGSFLDHLFFCYEYSHHHYPQHSALVSFLHSIMGTATNTFAMKLEKLPLLAELISDFELRHVQAFPSILRLISDNHLLEELTEQHKRLDQLEAVSFYRVIDNTPCRLEKEDLWIQLNYHLMHFVDFLPAANWQTHFSDPVLQTFQKLSSFLDLIGQRQAKVDIAFPEPKGPFAKATREKLSLGGRISTLIPASLKRRLAAKSIRTFSQKINHSLDYTLHWKN